MDLYAKGLAWGILGTYDHILDLIGVRNIGKKVDVGSFMIDSAFIDGVIEGMKSRISEQIQKVLIDEARKSNIDTGKLR